MQVTLALEGKLLLVSTGTVMKLCCPFLRTLCTLWMNCAVGGAAVVIRTIAKKRDQSCMHSQIFGLGYNTTNAIHRMNGAGAVDTSNRQSVTREIDTYVAQLLCTCIYGSTRAWTDTWLSEKHERKL